MATRSVTLDLGGRFTRTIGVPPPAPPPPVGGDDDLAVLRLTANTTLTDQGIYIVDSAAAQRTIVLPLLSAVPVTGFRIQIKRVGAQQVFLDTQGADVFDDGAVRKTVFTDFGGFVCFADDAATAWYVGGYLGAVT